MEQLKFFLSFWSNVLVWWIHCFKMAASQSAHSAILYCPRKERVYASPHFSLRAVWSGYRCSACSSRFEGKIGTGIRTCTLSEDNTIMLNVPISKAKWQFEGPKEKRAAPLLLTKLYMIVTIWFFPLKSWVFSLCWREDWAREKTTIWFDPAGLLVVNFFLTKKI